MSSSRSLPYQWHLDGNYLIGITGDRWWSLLKQNHFHVSPVYWHRVAATTVMSGVSTVLSGVEAWRYNRAIAATELSADPIFILGHWRSGTTLLHELLALDIEQLAYPNTFEVMSPQTFLSTESLLSRWLAKLVPDRRPMDNMSLKVNSPQEDEFAIALMTLQSYYLGLSFPDAEQHYERYLTLENLTPEELQQWQHQFLWFLKKLTFKYQRPLVLKSPPHTARIRLLLKLFPQAKFVHIHRHPYDVFRSMRHYFHTAGWLTYLQKPDLKTLDQAILRRYRLLYDAYFEQRQLIPADQFYEVSFSALEQDPIATVKQIYKQFQLSYSDRLDPRLQGYINARQNYRKNSFPALDAETQQRIQQEWQGAFAAWGYATG
ncbi:MAG: sulfotransferase [Leptolyngbyaceae cyanobacterium]